MKKLINTIIVILLMSTLTYGQILNFEIFNKKVSELVEYEQKLNSEQIITKTIYYVNESYAQPVIFSRNEVLMLDLMVEYYFNKEDSLISLVNYEWNMEDYQKNNNDSTYLKFHDSFLTRYEVLKSEISKNFGKPNSFVSNSESIFTGENDTYFEESTKWINKNQVVSLYIILSSSNLETMSFSVKPTYKIRISIYNKEKS